MPQLMYLFPFFTVRNNADLNIHISVFTFMNILHILSMVMVPKIYTCLVFPAFNCLSTYLPPTALIKLKIKLDLDPDALYFSPITAL